MHKIYVSMGAYIYILQYIYITVYIIYVDIWSTSGNLRHRRPHCMRWNWGVLDQRKPWLAFHEDHGGKPGENEIP